MVRESEIRDGELTVALFYREHGTWQRVAFAALEPALWTLSEWQADGVESSSVPLDELLASSDVVVVVTAHAAIDWDAVYATASLVVAVSCQNDGRNERARRRQMPQQVQATHPRHPQVEHEAAGSLPMGGLQERFRGDERLGGETHRAQEIAERSAEGGVVINDDYAPVESAGVYPQGSSKR
jgi:hypothetical protein